MNAGMRNVYSGGLSISFESITQIVVHGQYLDPHLFICFFIFYFLDASFCLFFSHFVLGNSSIYLIKRMLLKFSRVFKYTFLSKPTLCGKKVKNNFKSIIFCIKLYNKKNNQK